MKILYQDLYLLDKLDIKEKKKRLEKEYIE
jgi:hypothetical protein